VDNARRHGCTRREADVGCSTSEGFHVTRMLKTAHFDQDGNLTLRKQLLSKSNQQLCKEI